MFKKMKLSLKMGLGFGLLILLLAALGGLAVFKMMTVNAIANVMEAKNVPSVQLANDVERDSLTAMYNARGYALAEQENYKEAALKNLNEVLDGLKAAKELAEKKNMPELKEAVKVAEDRAAEYKKLFDQTATLIDAMKKDREEMNKAATAYMKVCYDFLDGQNESLNKEIASNESADKLKERVKKVTLCNDVIDLGNAVRIAAWKAQSLRDPKIIQDAQVTFDKIDKILDELKPLTHQEANLKQIEECRKAGDDYQKSLNSLLASWLKLQDVGKERGAKGDEVLKQARETAQLGMTQTSDGAKNAAKALSLASTVMVGGVIGAVIVGLALAFFLTRAITAPIARIFQGLKTFSTEELNVTGATFRTIAEQISSASNQVASGSQQQAQGASEQASSLEETSSSLEEMASMTKQNADNASQANLVARQAAELAGTGVESMKRMQEAIDKIKNSATETAKIIKTIDEIAFQTNLLALNAAVEAARAGEAGKGFAVVAEEVRNLARRSAEAAKTTADLIEGSQRNAEAGVSVTTEVAKNLHDIKENVGKMATLVGEIAAASKEQSQGIDQVNTAVSEMDKVVQQNAANAEESAAAAEEMSSQVEAMMDVLGHARENGAQRKPALAAGKSHLAIGSGVSHKPTGAARLLAHNSNTGKSSDSALHRAAHKHDRPEEVIPLDDKDLKEF
ncbi:MAG: methyl-accepting chemotaxis protein [Magnetococcus sp. WYHC-3]